MSAEHGYGNAPDVRFRDVGIGLDIRWRCFGCNKTRPTLGSKGAGVFKRCVECVAAKAVRKAARS